MGRAIQQGEVARLVFGMFDSAGVAVTGITPAAEISKDGGAFAACTNAEVEISDGFYYVETTTTESNATGTLVLKVTGAGAEEWRDDFEVRDFVVVGDFNNLDAAGVRTAVGLAAANLDTQLSDIGSDHLAEIYEGTETLQDFYRLVRSVLVGKASISGSIVTYRDEADTKDRVTSTVDVGNNRTAVTVDGS